jgi:hypothetical protein
VPSTQCHTHCFSSNIQGHTVATGAYCTLHAAETSTKTCSRSRNPVAVHGYCLCLVTSSSCMCIHMQILEFYPHPPSRHPLLVAPSLAMTTAALHQALPAVLLVMLLLHSAVRPTLALTCYVTYTKDAKAPPSKSTEVMAVDDKRAGLFCIRYKAPDGWFYGHADSPTCDLMKEYPGVYRYALCCSSARCNAPVKALDPVRTIVPSLPGTSGGR